MKHTFILTRGYHAGVLVFTQNQIDPFDGINICRSGLEEYFPNTKTASTIEIVVSTVRQRRKGEKKIKIDWGMNLVIKDRAVSLFTSTRVFLRGILNNQTDVYVQVRKIK